MYKQDWSALEVQALKEFFIAGDSIKCIAAKIGRSPTAINKALTRFNVRPPNISRTLNIPKNLKKTFYNKKIIKIKQKYAPQWVEWKDALSWFAQFVPYIEIGKFYLINDDMLTINQMLLTINRLRTSKELPVFLVQELTW